MPKKIVREPKIKQEARCVRYKTVFSKALGKEVKRCAEFAP